ncbi:patatin-like phospholipase family protein [Nanoarchaeota archaeon]
MCTKTTEFLGNAFSDSKTKTSIILSGGADLAVFFELGAMSVLEERLGMKVENLHVMAGGSGGAISGFLKAAGIDCDQPGVVPQIKDVLRTDKSNKTGLEKLGKYSQDGVIEHISSLVNNEYQHWKDLPVDLRIASTMFYPKIKKVIFSKHNKSIDGQYISTYDAVKCSITVPALYTPVKLANTYHLDGEIIGPIPLEEGRDSDVMVIISVYGPYNGFLLNPKHSIPNKFQKLNQLWMKYRINKMKKDNPKLKAILIQNQYDDHDIATYNKFSLKNDEALKTEGRRAVWKAKFI